MHLAPHLLVPYHPPPGCLEQLLTWVWWLVRWALTVGLLVGFGWCLRDLTEAARCPGFWASVLVAFAMMAGLLVGAGAVVLRLMRRRGTE